MNIEMRKAGNLSSETQLFDPKTFQVEVHFLSLLWKLALARRDESLGYLYTEEQNREEAGGKGCRGPHAAKVRIIERSFMLDSGLIYSVSVAPTCVFAAVD